MTVSSWRRSVAAATLAALMGGCAGLDGAGPAAEASGSPAAPAEPAAPPRATATSPAPESGPPTSAASAGLAPVALDAAVQRAAERLFADAQSVLADAPRDIVIDPLIDARTGQQTLAGVAVGAQLVRLIAAQQPRWKVQPFGRQSLGAAPLLLLGSLTPVDLNAASERAPSTVDAYRLWLTLADLRTGKVIAKRLDRALPAGVSAEPTRFHHDAVTPFVDRTTTAYLRSAQIDAGVGDPLDPLYVMRLPAAAVIHEAITAYNANQPGTAQRLFAEAARLADADDLRVLNGRYLSAWRLGRRQDAAEAVSRIVAAGLANRTLALKIQFEPGTTQLLGPADLRAQVRLWLREVARQAHAGQLCLRVIGHAGRSGDAEQVQALRRAAVVRWILATEAPASAKRFTTAGAGPGENLFGPANDDARDPLDRRIELRVVDCP